MTRSSLRIDHRATSVDEILLLELLPVLTLRKKIKEDDLIKLNLNKKENGHMLKIIPCMCV
jgi:hypothetical protein